MASMDLTIASTVATTLNSKKAWDSLHTTFANKSHTRIFSLKDQLNTVSKETKSVAEYLREIWSLSNELVIAGAPISNEELIVKILSGLGSEFREILVAIRARDSSISYEELYDKLLGHKLFLKHEELKKLPISITTIVAQKNNSSNATFKNNRRWNPS